METAKHVDSLTVAEILEIWEQGRTTVVTSMTKFLGENDEVTKKHLGLLFLREVRRLAKSEVMREFICKALKETFNKNGISDEDTTNRYNHFQTFKLDLDTFRRIVKKRNGAINVARLAKDVKKFFGANGSYTYVIITIKGYYSIDNRMNDKIEIPLSQKTSQELVVAKDAPGAIPPTEPAWSRSPDSKPSNS